MSVDPRKIHAYVGVGQVEFGITRTQARSRIDGAPTTFRKGPFATNDTDAYDDLGLHVYYDSEDYVRCIMAFGSGPVHYSKIALLGRPLEEVFHDLAGIGLTPRYDDEGYWFDDAGFVLYAPDDVVKAVTVYRRGYYEEQVALASKL